MPDIAIDVQAVSKRFRLFTEKATSLKERIVHGGRIAHEDLWALREISLEIREGETLGILGRNGSGKSTLLKCICGVLQPSSGQVVVRGDLAGLLELGAGFQQDLSGRDNIYLNGMLLGLSRREIQQRFDEIVAFSELEKFIDNQVKFYSSGMYVRLGFAVAVSMDPDILVIDEVLSVGDERFQRKCLDRVRQFQKDGRTIVLVSHSPDEVRTICDRGLVLQDGHAVCLGAPAEAVQVFRERLLEAGEAIAATTAPDAPMTEPGHGRTIAAGARAGAITTNGTAGEVGVGGSAGGGRGASGDEATGQGGDDAGDRGRTGAAEEGTAGASVGGGSGARGATDAASGPVELHLAEVVVADPPAGSPVPSRSTLVVDVGYHAGAAVDAVAVRLEVCDEDGSVLYRTDTAAGALLDLAAGPGVVRLEIVDVPFLDGDFLVNVGLQNRLGGTVYDWRERACRFAVASNGQDAGQVAMSVRVAQVA